MAKIPVDVHLPVIFADNRTKPHNAAKNQRKKFVADDVQGRQFGTNTKKLEISDNYTCAEPF